MNSICRNYRSTSSSDEDAAAASDAGDGRSPLAPRASPQPSLPPPPAVVGPSLPPAARARRPRPSTILDDAQTFEFTAYQRKRQRRRRLQPTDGDAEPPPARPDAQGDVSPLFDGVEEVADAADALGRAVGRLTPAFQLRGHGKAVNCLRWSPRFPPLALSASMDGTVRVWDASRRCCRRVLRLHGASLGVKSARWSLDGRHALSGGYDGRAVYADVETGRVLRAFAFPTVRDRSGTAMGRQGEAVTSVGVHPRERDWVVAGTSRGGIHSFDLREPHDRPALSFSRAFAQVHDLLFLSSTAGDAGGDAGGDVRLVSSADVTRRDASNQTLLVWDFRSATLLFDRLDADMHAFQCLRRHPTRAQFVAQSAADCAALFSSVAPYKRVRRKRPATASSNKFAGFSGAHQVAGYAIQCSFSADGSLFATGDASGRIVLYSDASGRVAQSVRLSDEQTPVMCAEFSPRPLAAGIALAAGVYDGSIHVMSAQQVE